MSNFSLEYARFMSGQVKAEIEPKLDSATPRKTMYWLTGDRTSSGESYCVDCVEKALKKAGKTDKTVIKDGGWPTECDSHQFCEICGAPLDVILTDYAAMEDLSHFENVVGEIPSFSDLSGDQAMELYEALDVANVWGVEGRHFPALASFLKVAAPKLQQLAALAA